MASLHRHLQLEGPAHDRLAFRPDCPRCQARLSGRYPEPRVLSRRQEAAATAALVAASAVLPAAGALARESDAVGVPTPAAPPAIVTDDQGGGLPPLESGDEHRSPTAVPTAPRDAADGAASAEVELPSVEAWHRESSPRQSSPPTDDPAPAPSESTTYESSPPTATSPARQSSPEPPSNPVPPASNPQPPATAEPESTPAPAGEAAPAPRSAPSAPPTTRGGTSTGPGSASPPPPSRGASRRASSRPGARPPSDGGRAGATSGEGSRGERPAVQDGDAPHARAQADERQEAAADAPGGGRAAPPADDGEHGPRPSTHVVQPGESLWLVAEQQLGEHATDVQVAARVERLWQLNAGRIGTGDPDLIYPGQELLLP